MVMHRDITKDDLKDDLGKAVDLFDALCIVTGRAQEILEHEEETQPVVHRKAKKPTICILPKRRRDEAGPSPAPEPKRRKPKRERRPPLPLLAEKLPLPAEFHAAIEEMALPEIQPVVHRKGKKPIICILPKRRRDEAGPSPAPEPKRRKPKPKPKPKRERRVSFPLLAEKPPLPAEFHAVIEEMAATEVKLVIQKGLYKTDLSNGHNRLSIPFKDIENDFLTEEEKQYLLGQDEKKNKLFLEVKIVQPSLEVETVKLCRWDMHKENGKTSSAYIIRGKWNTIVMKNKLSLGMTLQLWCFRVDRELCFALVRVPTN